MGQAQRRLIQPGGPVEFPGLAGPPFHPLDRLKGRVIMDEPRAIVTRAEAKAAGLKRYFTGAPCKHGHIEERNTLNKCCFGCQRVSAAIFRSKPEAKDRAKASARRSYLANRDKVLARGKARNATGYNKRYYEQNKEKFIAGVKAWIKRNPERRNAYRQNRRAAGSCRLSPDVVAGIFKAQRGKCAVCRTNLKASGYHIDHIKAVTRGGTSDPNNIQLLCPTCNRSKGARDPIVFMQSLGRLL